MGNINGAEGLRVMMPNKSTRDVIASFWVSGILLSAPRQGGGLAAWERVQPSSLKVVGPNPHVYVCSHDLRKQGKVQV